MAIGGYDDQITLGFPITTCGITRMDSPLSIAGSVASIGAAIWAFVQARKATAAATKAALMRDEIVNRRHLIEVSQIYADTKRILAVTREVGPAANVKLLRGFDASKVARQVEEYAQQLLEQSSHYHDHFGNAAKDLCDQLRPQIESLADATTPEQIKSAGKSICHSIEAFVPLAKALADGQRERTPKALEGN